MIFQLHQSLSLFKPVKNKNQYPLLKFKVIFVSEIQGFCCYGHLPGTGSDFLPNPNGSTPPNMETPPTGLRGEEPEGDDWGSFFEGLEVEENKSSSSSDFGDPNKFGF